VPAAVLAAEALEEACLEEQHPAVEASFLVPPPAPAVAAVEEASLALQRPAVEGLFSEAAAAAVVVERACLEGPLLALA